MKSLEFVVKQNLVWHDVIMKVTLHHLCHILLVRSREGNGTPLQYSCLEKPMDRGAWWAAVHGVAKGRTRLSDFTFSFHFHALEKEMATHSSVLAWGIPETGESGGLLSIGSHRVGHDWSDLAAALVRSTGPTHTQEEINNGMNAIHVKAGSMLESVTAAVKIVCVERTEISTPVKTSEKRAKV